MTRDIGFNLRIIPKETDMDQFWSDGFSDRTMPEQTVQRLAGFERVFFAYNHLVASLQRKWSLAGKEVILTGLAPAITAPGHPINTGTDPPSQRVAPMTTALPSIAKIAELLGGEAQRQPGSRARARPQRWRSVSERLARCERAGRFRGQQLRRRRCHRVP